MLHKVISGGQTGVDQAVLAAAKMVGFETGGWAPKGWETANGPAEELLRGYGLVESRGGYKARTLANVRDSDCTIRIARSFDSPGEKCTLNAIRTYKKPHIDFHTNLLTDDELRCEAVEDLQEYITETEIETLNVAGNRQPRAGLDIYGIAYDFLHEVFRRIMVEQILKGNIPRHWIQETGEVERRLVYLEVPPRIGR